MAGALGDILGATFVMMPRVITGDAGPPPDSTPYNSTDRFRGVPIPRDRKRPDVAEVEGYGLVPVIGAGELTTDITIAGTLEQDAEGYGRLDAEAALAAAAAIRTGAEAILAQEWGINAMMLCPSRGIARLANDATIAGVGAADVAMHGRLASDQPISGAGVVRSGAEAVLTRQQSRRYQQRLAAIAGAWWLRKHR